MTRPILIKNAEVFAPEKLGRRDIFIAGGRIVAMEESLEGLSVPGLETIDACGAIVTPGLIDQHIHVTGGGGEGGWKSRCPELVFSELVKAGVTTFLGVSGTDSMSRSIENLLAKVRGLKQEGASGWMWTSNYSYPVTTITDSVKTELFAIPEVLGVKIALGDHRCSFPSMEEVRSIVADVRVAGMLTGKTGFVHVHLGDYTSSFDIFDGIVASGLPIKHIRPTHVARHPAVFERAMGFAKQGGWIDITTGGGNYMGCAADAYDMAVENGVPVNRITMSSDGHGSMPRFNEAGEMVGLGVGSIMCNIETVQELARRHDLTTALLPMTRTVAEALTLEGKGVIEVGADADLLILNAEHEITDVFMGGVQQALDKLAVRGDHSGLVDGFFILAGEQDPVVGLLDLRPANLALFRHRHKGVVVHLLNLILGQPGHGDEVEQHHQQHGHHVVEDQRLFRGMDLIHGSFLLSLGAETDRNSASELVCILWTTAILAPCGRTVQKTICERKAADFILETRLIEIFAAFFR